MSPRLRLPVSVLATTALLGGAMAFSAPASADPGDVDTTMCPGTPVWVGGFDDSDAGQVVHGLTTTSGTTPTAFQGEFVSRIDDAFGNDVYLFKLSGSRITAPGGGVDAGIWEGISGSPVYDDDDNLIGSVSYGFTGNAGSDIAGVTPAANVLATEHAGDPETAASVPLPRAARAAIRAAGSSAGPTLRQLKPTRVALGAAPSAAGHDHFTQKSRTLSSNALASNALSSRSTGFGSAGSAQGVDSMVAGGNIATSWSAGSLVFASVGTITAICGDKVFAYGHPEQNVGESHQRMHSATTLQIQADGATSYTMVNINPEPTGALVEDGNNGVFGVLGRQPAQSIPVSTVTTYGSRAQQHRTTVSEPAALSTVVANQVFGEVSAVLGNSGSGTADVSWKITYRRAGSTTDRTFTRSQLVTSQSSFPEYSVDGPAGDVDTLLGASDEDITITSVEVTSRVTSRYHQAMRVAGITVKSGKTYKALATNARIKAKKGSTLAFRAVLEPVPGSKAPARVVPMSFTTAKSYGKSGRLTVSGDVSGESSYSGDEEFWFDEEPELLTFDQVLTALRSEARADKVTARLSYSLRGKRTRTTARTTPQVIVVGSRTNPITFVK